MQARLIADAVFNSEVGRILLTCAAALVVLLMIVIFAWGADQERHQGILAEVDRLSPPTIGQMALNESAARWLAVRAGGNATLAQPDRLWSAAEHVGMTSTPEDFSAFVCAVGAWWRGARSVDDMLWAWADYTFGEDGGRTLTRAVDDDVTELWADPVRSHFFTLSQRLSAKLCDARWVGLPPCLPPTVERPALSMGASGELVPGGVVCAEPGSSPAQIQAWFLAYGESLGMAVPPIPRGGQDLRSVGYVLDGESYEVQLPLPIDDVAATNRELLLSTALMDPTACPPFDALGTPAWDWRWALREAWYFDFPQGLSPEDLSAGV